MRINKTVIVAISLTVFIILNVLWSIIPAIRFDFSYGSFYTLSTATKRIINKIKKPLTIKAFISSDLPVGIQPLRDDVLSLLAEYKKQGRGNIIITIIDPKKNSQSLQEAQSAAIPPLQFSRVENDNYSISSVYFGAIIMYEDKKEVLPQLTDLENLEYDLTVAIYGMIRNNKETIGLVGFNSLFNDPSQPYFIAKELLDKQFNSEEISLSDYADNKQIDPKFATIIIATRKEAEYQDKDVNKLVNYLQKGGRVIFLVDGTAVNEDFTTVVTKHNLNQLFSKYGLTLQSDLVFSQSAELAQFASKSGVFFTTYPLWIKATNFDNTSGLFSGIHTLLFPWASSIKVRPVNNVKTTVLVKTDKNSWRQTNDYTVMPDKIISSAKKELQTFSIMTETQVGNKGRFILIPSSRFIDSQFLQNNSNLAFFTNLINNYASYGALSGIRSRGFTSFPLTSLPTGIKDTVKYGAILIFPILFAFFCGARLFRRQ